MSVDEDPSVARKNSRKKKNRGKATPPDVESSNNLSFGATVSRRSFASVIVTDALSDVRKRFHINPKE